MSLILLQRKEDTKDGLFGVLFILGKEFCVTVERMKKSKTHLPIPAGVYKLEPHSGTKYKDVVALVNEQFGVYHWPSKKAKRSAILIHPANFQSQLKGCIALGRLFTEMYDSNLNRETRAISNSVVTVKAFMRELEKLRGIAENGELYIEIKDPE